MTIDGVSLRAARSLLRLNQSQLAKRAHVSANCISKLERSTGTLSGRYETVCKVVQAIEAAGVEITDGGVCFK
jgi:predicted transcriptional regulator